MLIKDLYAKLSKGKQDKLSDFDQLILDCYKYEIFSDKKSHAKWFEVAFEKPYPTKMEELKGGLLKDIKKTVKARKKEDEFNEKMKMQRYARGFSDVDSWNIYSWFIEVMRPALIEMRKGLHGCPSSVPSMLPNNSQAVQMPDEEESEDMKQWKAVLDRMIFLLGEMDEETCSYKNPVQNEVDKAERWFTNKYGFFGQKFEELNNIPCSDDERGSKRMYFYHDEPTHPEWQLLREQWSKYEALKASYRNTCKEEFFKLFSHWFWDLWD
jgi:hypothetical protein